jgi:hypothetical protein
VRIHVARSTPIAAAGRVRIQADDRFTDGQKQALLAVVRSYLEANSE